MNYWPLAGIAVVVLGFAARLNAVLVVVAAGAVTGLASGMGPRELLAAFGEGFLANRYLAMFLLTLPVLGALERHGLREHAAGWIAKRRGLGLARLLVIYLGVRQLSAALGLTSLGGQAQTVRPLLAPMAESAARNEHGELDEDQSERVRAMAAATDNVGLFFGEDIFVAFGAVLLMQGVYAQQGIALEPLDIAVWGIPTALCAFTVHALRLRRFGARLRSGGAAGMITLAWVYAALGLFLGCCAWQTLRDRVNPRRFSSALFWGLLALAFLAGDRLPAEAVGLAVLALAAIAGLGGLRSGAYPEVAESERRARAARLGHRLFVPALAISVLTLLIALGAARIRVSGEPLLEQKPATVIALGLACLLSFAIALRVTGERPALALHGARRLLDAIGWAALLPLLLAMLGGVFARAGVGELVSGLLTSWLPLDVRAVALLAYAFGMALFTIVMGNAFAAFPVMAVGLGLPVLAAQHGANPAPLAAIGMLCGYCGTLLTPMAANYNIVPAALLGLRDQHGVIRAQVGTALPLFGLNVLLLFLLT